MKIKILLTALLAITSITMIAQTSKKKALVVYYSWSPSGNTRAMAQDIQKATGADIFEVVPQKAYPADYDQCCNQTKQEIKNGIKPAIKAKVKDMAQYDIIFIGSPCWWSTIAPPMVTFLSYYDFKGKTVIPFMTHGGSGMGRSESDIKKLCTGATVVKGKPIYGTSVGKSKDEIMQWAKSVIK